MSVETCMSPEPSRRQRTKRQPVITQAEAMLSLDDLAVLLGTSRRSVERLRAAGKLPKPSIVVGSRSARWSRTVIQAWIESGGMRRAG